MRTCQNTYYGWDSMKQTLLILAALLFISFKSFAAFDNNHSAWDSILKNYTKENDGQVYVNYKALIKNKEELNRYLSQLSSVSRSDFDSFSNHQKLAFWINSYNAFTVKLVVDNYPIKSIRELGNGVFQLGPWRDEFINLFGEKFSLDDIEHNIIRKQFDEPRIHFAVNCASLSCPSLMREAFVGERLNEQLDSAAKFFLNNTSKNYVKDNILYVSKIFKWYGEDFVQKYGSVLNFVKQKIDLPDKKYEIKFNDYDWKLNEFENIVNN